MMNTDNKESVSLKGYDWDRSAKDYVSYRPGQPDSYYDFLANYNLGIRGQHIVDLGAGPGLLACAFAQRGGLVTGIDSSQGQINQARTLAKKLNLNVSFHVCLAEEMPYYEEPVDLAVANMCWGYFDQQRVLDRLVPQMSSFGSLVISSLRWLPSDPAVILTDSFFSDVGIGARPVEAKNPGNVIESRVNDTRFYLHASTNYVEPIKFNLTSWAGRCMASKHWLSGVPRGEDKEYGEIFKSHLSKLGNDEFNVKHGVSIQVYRLI